MKNYHVRCNDCGETSSVYATSIFIALEDHEQNHVCQAKQLPDLEDISLKGITKEGLFVSV